MRWNDLWPKRRTSHSPVTRHSWGELMHTFLDEARVFVRSGDGGKGSMHFRREKYVPLGGPDGGDGGDGGSVIVQADRGLNTLFTFRRNRRFVAQNGEAGGPSRMHGRNGADTIVEVPVGTVLM